MWSQPYNDKVRYFESYKEPLTGRKRIVSCILPKDTAANRKKATQILQDRISQRMVLPDPEPDDITLAELVVKYHEHKVCLAAMGAGKNSTAHKATYMFRAIEEMLGKDTKLSSLTARYITNRLKASGENAHTLNERIIRLKALLRWAYENDYLKDVGFLAKIKPFPEKQTARERIQDKYMERDELQMVLNAIDVRRWELLTRFLCLSGLRIGELTALDDKDVDKEYIHVTKTYSFESLEISRPKTAGSVRDVYIQPELAAVIREIRAYMRLQKMRLGRPSKLFFPDEDGSYLHYDNYRIYFKKICTRTIGKPLTPHACRHTMVSLFAEAGVSLDAISRRLGHYDSSLTRDVYFHITKKMKERDNEEIRKVMIL